MQTAASGDRPLMVTAAAGWRRLPWGLLVLAGVTFPCALLYYAAGFSNFRLPSSRNSPTLLEHAFSSQSPRTNDSSDSGGDKIKLKTVLKEAAMEDNTVILTTLNEAWAVPGSVLDLFLESFRTGEGTDRLLKHLVIVAMDDKAYERCKSTHPHCYALKTEGVDFSQEKLFLTEDYLKMIWRRIDFLRVVLELGYDFIFTDADITWFRDPMPFFFKDCDFQIACDRFNGNPDDRTNSINGGFKYIRSNERTIKFYKYWYGKREEHPGAHDQDVLNYIKGDQFLRDIGLCMKFLPTVHFGGICEPSSDFNQVSTMHANCCIGLKDKLNDLKIILEDWRLYNALPPRAKARHEHKWRVPQLCSTAPHQ